VQQKLFDMSNAFNQQAYEAANKLADITVRTYGKLVQQQVDIAGLCWESGVKQLELVHDAKDVSSYLIAKVKWPKIPPSKHSRPTKRRWTSWSKHATNLILGL
jgi:hypothetical protein